MRVAIVGGGQLGRMLVQAGERLGVACVTLDPAADSPAAQVGPSIVGGYDDATALTTLVDGADVVTYEFENVPAASLAALSGLGVEVAPGPKALSAAQDRVDEKTFLNAQGVATVAFAAAATPAEAAAAVAKIGAPCLMKTRREGY
ncbi:MAG TPA: 5-(carboxyamino)imidazole ribonucleotide synthase, partial [Actinomycetota bacterium]|nr:5-(carboxyamino)imidazole ribonucleotide synthase [Actinomycetota bacterium]